MKVGHRVEQWNVIIRRQIDDEGSTKKYARLFWDIRKGFKMLRPSQIDLRNRLGGFSSTRPVCMRVHACV